VPELPFRRSYRGLLVDGDRILLAQHRIADGGTMWVGPGGGVEADESLVHALMRELHEETGFVWWPERPAIPTVREFAISAGGPWRRSKVPTPKA
jgi:8-oxo-dGTP pyrophosphatase MutT (NUDIX family)